MLNIFLVTTKHPRTSKVKRYPTDLNDKKWEIIKPLLPSALSGGRPRTVSLRKLINAILYINTFAKIRKEKTKDGQKLVKY